MFSYTPPRFIFRADGNARIGLGHLVRLLALADMLRGLATGLFLVREPTPAVEALLKAQGWQVVALPADRPLAAEADWLAGHFLQPSDVLILDGYEFDTAYQTRLRSSGCALVAVDDLRAWPVVADVLINHSPGVSPTDYQHNDYTKFLLGPAFSLLRRPFLEAATPPRPPVNPSSALICFGGADPLRLTARTLRALLQLPQVQRVSLVVGSAFGDVAVLQQLAKQHPEHRIAIRQNADAKALIALISQHAVAVVPASTVLIEALVLGCPAITGYYIDNQRALAEYTQAYGQAFSVGDFAQLSDEELAAALQSSLQAVASIPRQPYAERLRPDLLRATISQLLDYE